MLSNAISETAAVAPSGHFYPLTIRAIKHETRDAVTVTLDVPRELQDKFRFIQGQYLTFRARIGGEEVRRSYSICSAVQDGMLRVAIKRTPGGIFSNWVIENLKPGCALEVMPPEGRFHVQLSAGNKRDYVAFAAGSGITPIFSIIKTTLLTEPESTFTLFYGNRASHSVILREELAELKDRFINRFSLIHIMSREHQDVELLNGRITADKSEQLLKQFCRFENLDTVFLCGPQDMVDGIAARLEALGFPESRIKIELFTVKEPEARKIRKATATPIEAECQVTLIVDGDQRVFSMQKETESILDAALHRGIDLRHSCKSGVCATCRSKLVEGQVDMDANYALEDYEIARGFILTCQSYPVTDHVTVDFDQDN
ncbi:MAG: phenylacetate-CoA oxygenase/reductase subunit PaaK [Acidobacteriaceae bacterium]|nr:phenylacetate-CoA oxygenase/reductase subunit PaaK [Acidobacteriaceae bacterium]